MNHTTIPVTAQGEPIPLVKLGQGREEEPQTFAAKLRAAGYQEPVLSKESGQEKISNSTAPPDGLTQEEFNALTGRGLDTPVISNEEFVEKIAVVSREGFRAGVLSAIAGGVIIACFYLAWGLVAACLFAAVCVGLVGGMLITQEWK